MMTPEQKFQQLYQEMAKLCDQQGWGDFSAYARSREIYAATVLGHTIANTFSGADAINQQGEEVEYKSTTAKNCQGCYTGVSVQPTWEEQERYLLEEKIAKYPEHYYNRFEDGHLVESWVILGDVVHQTLLPKFKKRFSTILRKKDPRLSATITWGEIRKLGKKVL
tara:strand:+ start:84 stop:581 length:498 start_codon:yes stop_codon:yes gene_type:complete